ncbi:MAG TPA: type II secretion system F family protein [Patescibacteria group bacterium]|nr:type II secretion system F family protein [Patescibacteria group bacterium]
MDKLILKHRPLAENSVLAEEPADKDKDASETAPKVSDGDMPEKEPDKKIESPATQGTEKDISLVSKPTASLSSPSTASAKEQIPPSARTLPQKDAAAAPTNKMKRKRVTWLTIGVKQDKIYFIENLSMLLFAGMNIITALDSIEVGLKSKKMREIVEELKDEIGEGIPIWEALEHTGLLAAHSLALIKIGEKSGRLSANLKVIATQEQKERIFRSKVTSAMLYPAIVLFFTLIVGVGIAWFILPKLSGVFSSLNIKLPITTKFLLGFGEFLGKYGTIVVPSFLVALIILFYFIFFFPKTKIIGQKIIFRIPGVNILSQQIELSRFGFILGTLLSAGMPLVDALSSLAEITGFFDYKKFYKYLSTNIEEGNSFQKCFAGYKHSDRLIPFPVQQMIVASEQSGNLKETLRAIGDNFEEKTDISTKNLSVALEPILLFVIWAVVVFVALSVIMPIYSLIGGFNP